VGGGCGCRSETGWYPRSLPSAHRHQFLRKAREDLRFAVGDDDEILDPNAAGALEVDTRLDRQDIVIDKDVRGRLGHVRRFVDVDADSVAKPVTELVTE